MKSNKKTQSVKPVFSIIAGIICFILLTLFDHITKMWAVLHLAGQEPIIIIKNVFQLRYLENHGAAFSILQGRFTILIIVTIIVLALIVYLYARIPFNRRYRILRILMVFISAGAAGNFIDRLTQHYVVDFFYINLIDFPIFNVADCYVTISVIVLVFVLIFGLKEDDLSDIAKRLVPRKRKTEDES